MKNNFNNPYVRKAVEEIRTTQYQIKSDQERILNEIKILHETSPDFCFDNLLELAGKQINKDLELAQQFNAAIKPYTGIEIGHGIKFNKLHDIFELINSEGIISYENMSAILNGNMPSGYDNSITVGELPALGKENAYWGTSKPTLITAFLDAVRYCIDKKSIIEAYDTEESAIFHNFNLPDNVVESVSALGSRFVNQASGNKSYTLTIPHSGYSFGGARDSAKKFKPHDCTSFLEQTYALPAKSGSSIDLYLAHLNLGKDITLNPDGWCESLSGGLVKLFDVSDHKPEPGDIIVTRKYAHNGSNSPQDCLKGGGHAAIYIGEEESTGMVTTLAFNRNMPSKEGFGVEVSNFSDSQVRCFLHRNKNSISSFYHEEHDQYPEFTDLEAMVGSYDEQILLGVIASEETHDLSF